jgi:hypothetical protein
MHADIMSKMTCGRHLKMVRDKAAGLPPSPNSNIISPFSVPALEILVAYSESKDHTVSLLREARDDTGVHFRTDGTARSYVKVAGVVSPSVGCVAIECSTN